MCVCVGLRRRRENFALDLINFKISRARGDTFHLLTGASSCVVFGIVSGNETHDYGNMHNGRIIKRSTVTLRATTFQLGWS